MANGQRTIDKKSSSVVPADGNPTTVVSFTLANNERARIQGVVQTLKPLVALDGTTYSARFYVEAERNGAGTLSVGTLQVADATGTPGSGTAWTAADAGSGAVALRFTGNGFRGVCFAELFKTEQSQS